MERKPQIEELLSQIKLLELALEFYGNKKNYPKMVNLDIGSQARFALKQIKDTDKYSDNLIENFNKVIEENNENVAVTGNSLNKNLIDKELLSKTLEIINKLKEV